MKIINLHFFKNKGKSTEELLDGCRRGDASCQELFFKRYAPKIMTVCRRYEHPDFGASDILQESFLLIFKNISRFDPKKASIETWMKKIAVNTALKVIRSRKISFLDPETYHIQLANIPDEIPEVETFSEEFLLATIQELPAGYRTVFNLFVVDGFSHKEIAASLNISVQTSKSQLSKAKKLLRKELSFYQKKANNQPRNILNLGS